MKRIHVALAILFAATFTVIGCGGGGGSSGGGGGISVSVSPSSATVLPNGSVALTATVIGTTNTAVTWTYVGGGLQVLNNTATFTAPSTVGTCSVTAKSVADSSKSKSISIVVSTSGGGGGGGTGTTSLHGTVLDSYGIPVDGAQVSWSGGTKAAATTNSLGLYTLTGVPVGTSITITITRSGLTTTTLNGVVIDPTAGSDASMDVVMNSEAPPAGSIITINSYNSSQPIEIVLNERKQFQIEVQKPAGTPIIPSVASGWMPTVLVTGAADGAPYPTDPPYDPTLFQVTGTQVGATAKITVMLARADGTLASKTVTTTVTEVGLPPPPPLTP